MFTCDFHKCVHYVWSFTLSLHYTFALQLRFYFINLVFYRVLQFYIQRKDYRKWIKCVNYYKVLREEKPINCILLPPNTPKIVQRPNDIVYWPVVKCSWYFISVWVAFLVSTIVFVQRGDIQLTLCGFNRQCERAVTTGQSMKFCEVIHFAFLLSVVCICTTLSTYISVQL